MGKMLGRRLLAVQVALSSHARVFEGVPGGPLAKLSSMISWLLRVRDFWALWISRERGIHWRNSPDAVSTGRMAGQDIYVLSVDRHCDG